MSLRVEWICDEASAERCPVFPAEVKDRLHWSFLDSSQLTGRDKIRYRGCLTRSGQCYLSSLGDIIWIIFWFIARLPLCNVFNGLKASSAKGAEQYWIP